MGRIYYKNLEYNRRRGINAKDQYAYYITNSKELLKFKELLDKCIFHTKKERDKELFFKLLKMKLNKKHLKKESLDEMIKLIRSMNSGSRENFKVKAL